MTHSERHPYTFLVAAAALGIALAGCAKQPTSSLTSAPAPTGIASSTAGTDSGAPVPAKHDDSTSGTSFNSGPTPWGTRPSPSEFSPSPALKDVFFAFDRYDITPAAAKVLDESAFWLKDNSRFLILIEGHADERGTNEYNLSLAERRAKAALNYLASRGVHSARVSVISFGEERPQCTEKNEGCWSKNRRARFLVKGQ
jgi:peptidoglycan-associated lipoprotein